MYKRFVMQLMLCNMLFCMAWFCVKGIQVDKLIATPAFQLSLNDDSSLKPKADRFFGILRRAASGQRVVDYEVLKKKDQYNLSGEDYEALLRIVQAEAGSEDEKGKMLVAGVVLNRVENSRFPGTVREVVMQHSDGVYQFSPVANGTYYSVKVSEETKAAVDKVLSGENESGGALYFASRRYADSGKMKWFDQALTHLYDYGGHEFFAG